MQPVMTSWHVMALVTFHDMLWHLHEPPRHDMRTMSRRLMPSQGSEPETHWCPKTDFGSILMHLSDPVWYIYILDPIWCIRFWIRSDIQHTLHFLIQLSQHTRTHSREGGFEWSSDVKELQLHFFGGIHFGGIHPTVLLWPLREAVRRIFHRVFIGKYSSQLSCQCFLCWGGRCTIELHDDDCIMFGLSSYCTAWWPSSSSVYIGFQCPLIRSSLLLFLL